MNIMLLDRDGTIIKEPHDHRVDRESKIELYSDTIDGLRHLADHNFSIIFVTNQAGIGEGRITEQDFHRIHKRVLELISPSGIQVLDTYMCPHADADGCDCRKPHPELLLRALRDYNIDPHRTCYIGDRSSDIMAGKNAGIQTIFLEIENTLPQDITATHVAKNFLDAVKWAVKNI